MDNDHIADNGLEANSELQNLAKNYLELRPLKSVSMQMQCNSVLAQLKQKVGREDLALEAIEKLASGQKLPREYVFEGKISLKLKPRSSYEHVKASEPPAETKHLPQSLLVPLTRLKPILDFKANALDLIENGYSPIPISPQTKKPAVKKWEQFCERQPTKAEIERWDKDFPGCGIGVCCGFGEVIAIDTDTDEPEVAAAVLRLVPGPHIKKVGKRGFTVFARGKLKNEKIKLAAGQVEVLAHGRQTVLPPSIHPDTDEPYFWLTCECGCSYPTYDDEEVGSIPLDTLYWLPADGLPELPDDFRNQLVQELSPWLEAEKQPSEPASPYSPYSQVCVSADPRRPKVAAGLLEKLVQEVANAKVGERNDTLLRCAGQLFVQVRHELLSGEEVTVALASAFKSNRIEGDDPKEFEATLLKAWAWSEGKALPDLRDRPISKAERGQATSKAQAGFDLDKLSLTDDQRKWIAEGLPTTEGPISFVRGVVGNVGPQIARGLLTNPAHRISDELNGFGEKWLDAQIAEARKSVQEAKKPASELEAAAKQLLAKECLRVDGTKNKGPRLYEATEKLGPYVHYKVLTEQEVFDALRAACEDDWKPKWQESMENALKAAEGKPLPKLAGSRGSKIGLLISALGLRIRFNTFSMQTEVEWNGEFQSIDDEVLTAIWRTADEAGLQVKPDLLDRALKSEGLKTPVHPVLEYLEHLRWDGVPRVETWLSRYAGAEDTPLNRAIAALVLVAAVRRVKEPGCKFDYMLVLESLQQGKKKSLLLRRLFGAEWFEENLDFGAKAKELIEQTEGKWGIELAELTGIQKSDVESIKAMISRQSDKARLSFERKAATRLRQFVLTGTSNDRAYLRDQTGNRRFLPVEVMNEIDAEGLLIDRDQLWAEAYELEKTYGWLVLPAEFHEAVRLEQEKRVVKEPIAEELESKLDGVVGKITMASVWASLGMQEVGRRTPSAAKTIKVTMERLGWKQKRFKYKRQIHHEEGGKEVRPEGYASGDGDDLPWLGVVKRGDGSVYLEECHGDEWQAVNGGVREPDNGQR